MSNFSEPMGFYEAIWDGVGIGDGGDLEEALLSFVVVKPEDGDWIQACSSKDVNPHVNRYSSFDDYLDNADSLETIQVTASMVMSALEHF